MCLDLNHTSNFNKKILPFFQEKNTCLAPPLLLYLSAVSIVIAKCSIHVKRSKYLKNLEKGLRSEAWSVNIVFFCVYDREGTEQTHVGFLFLFVFAFFFSHRCCSQGSSGFNGQENKLWFWFVRYANPSHETWHTGCSQLQWSFWNGAKMPKELSPDTIWNGVGAWCPWALRGLS